MTQEFSVSTANRRFYNDDYDYDYGYGYGYL